MHDPHVVAFDIPRPWPQREKSHDAKPDEPRWKARYSWATWKKPWHGWMSFWTVAGYGIYWPALITIWHCEPGGHDALTVCRDRRWRWHVRHWRVQVHALQRLRRALLTRCEECGRKGRPNVSFDWDRNRGHWWQGERGLYHRECSSLIELRNVKERDERLIKALVAEVRVRSDEDMETTVERLTGHGNRTLDFHLRYRLKNILGVDREEDD